jgi:hypothetical protein
MSNPKKKRKYTVKNELKRIFHFLHFSTQYFAVEKKLNKY